MHSGKEVGLEIKVEKIKYMSRHQNAGKNQDMKIASRSFENVSQFIYLEMTVTNQNLIHEIEFWLCLLPFSPETSVFLSAVEKCKK
jgi:hypothetical protein